MKKYLILPAIIGLVAVPSLAMAQNETASSPSSTGSATTSLTKPVITTTSTTTPDTTTTSTTPVKTDDDTKPPIVVPAGSLTADQAKAVAVGLFPDLTVTKVETETEKGILVYEVKFSDGSEVTILASDGTVVANETHSNDESHSDNSSSNKHENEGRHLGQLKHDD